MAAVDILISNSPVMEYYVHLNKLFMLLDMNSECYRGQDYNTITINITSYGETPTGEINKEDSIERTSQTYQRWQINTRETPEDFLPYNIWARLKNYWYEISLTFNFQYNASPDGGNIYVSKIGYYIIDNRSPVLSGQLASSFIQGKLKDHLEKKNYLTAWIGVPPITPEINDTLPNINGGIVKQIINVYDVDQIQVEPSEINYLNLTKYIFRHKDVPRIVYEIFDGLPPEYSELTFKIIYNDEEYYYFLKGNLNFLTNNYQP